ncbi:histidine kinase [Rhodocytophaga rosea]|uniref:Histidine kinase n=1 Tax=Rhodocytophaga rosea TaxID=2704465 RepID=A0A6C0GIJ3_9BACT|nr:histidine kinase [Rhodocytophaga rosea]QHT67492.1 histidine kinase [Rhodocytophaga rosea]
MLPSSDTTVTRKITKLYLLALTAVALLSIGGQVLVQRSLRNQLSDSRVINMAGRQRMLSQKISKTVLLLTRTPDSIQAALYLSDLRKDVKTWEDSHKGLVSGHVNAIETPVNNSDSIRQMFARIEPHFNKMLTNVQQILQTYSNTSAPSYQVVEKNLNEVLRNEHPYLQLMDKIVFQYDAEAIQRVNTSQRIETILLISTLIVLLLEGIFIFRPAVSQIRHTIQMLVNSEQQTKQVNEELMQVNQSLEETREALLEATTQKHQQEMNEQKLRSSYLIEGQEEERKRIAREIHDGLGQMLTALKFSIEKVGDWVEDSEKGQKNLNQLRQLITQTITEARTISFNLMPAVLSDFGIASALKLLTGQIATSSEISITFTTNLTGERLVKNAEIGLYRIAQEAIHNAIKYAKASEITVDLSLKKKHIHLKIDDNGQGFAYDEFASKPGKNNPSAGISNMKERAFIINGDIKITTKPGKGTQIHVKIPYITLYHEQD